jgi:hypothetical protein
MATLKTGGRKKGTPNKVSATVKQNVLEVFEKLGGVNAMTCWAIEDPRSFYQLYGKLIPTEQAIEHSGEVQARLVIKG